MTNLEHPNGMDHKLTQQEQWSALHDGQLSGEAALALVRASLHDDSLMMQWRSMSVVAQVLRESSSASDVRPTSLPRSLPASLPTNATDTLMSTTPVASNESRWKMVAGVAAMAAVGSLVWGLLGTSGTSTPQGAVLAGNTSNPASPAITLVQAPALQAAGSTGNASSASNGQEATMIRNPRLDEFLAAHKQFGGVSALQQPAGSLRSVSVTVNQR